jgi:CSLREA domain-containing protein
MFYAAVLLFLIGGAVCSARANTFVVTTLADPGDGICTAANVGDGCTLREAINAANALAGADTIDATGVSGTIGLTAALPDLSSDITILGPGATLLKVSRSGSARFRVFHHPIGRSGQHLRREHYWRLDGRRREWREPRISRRLW